MPEQQAKARFEMIIRVLLQCLILASAIEVIGGCASAPADLKARTDIPAEHKTYRRISLDGGKRHRRICWDGRVENGYEQALKEFQSQGSFNMADLRQAIRDSRGP